MEKQSPREIMLDDMCRRMTRKARRNKIEVEQMLYDTDDVGRIEWIHINYKSGFVGHVEITGMDLPAVTQAVEKALTLGT